MPMVEQRGAAGAGSSEAILRAVATASRRFARDESWEDVIREVLHLLGNAAGVSRAYVFENSRSPEGQLLMSQRYEWVRPGVIPTIQDPSNHDYPYRPEYARWERVLGGGTTIFGPTREFPEGERVDLESEQILSTAFVPIFAGREWWGYMGLDDCATERQWTEVELDALEAAAETLGAAIARGRMSAQLEEAEARFRSHVEHIPAITYIEYTDSGKQLGYSEFYVSPQLETILGYPAETWMKDEDAAWWNTVVHPDDIDMIEREARRTSISGEPYMLEYRIRKANGDWAWVRDEAFLVQETGREPFWHGVMFDITDRREMEEKLRLVEAKYNALRARLPAVELDDLESAGPRPS